jgi:NADH:ubiquinone oxidoreductase subunit 5 (subunit L)/multisubunit Na+/H+ antiporter MnhA subunit
LSGVGPRSLANRFRSVRALYTVLYNRYYLDWLYDKVFVHGIRRVLAWIVHWVDHNVIDNAVDAVGGLTLRTGRFVDERIDRQVVDGVVRDVSTTADLSGATLRRVQNGSLQRYVVSMLATVVIVALIVVVAR